MKYKYILRAEGRVGIAIHSDLSMSEMQNYIRSKSKKFHPKGNDTYITLGVTDYINPEIMSVEDYANFNPYLIGIK